MDFLKTYGGMIILDTTVVVIVFLLFAPRDEHDRIIVFLKPKVTFWRVMLALTGTTFYLNWIREKIQIRVWRAERHAGIKLRETPPRPAHRWRSATPPRS